MLYMYTFEDGYTFVYMNMSDEELSSEEEEHGKLFSKVPYVRV